MWQFYYGDLLRLKRIVLTSFKNFIIAVYNVSKSTKSVK